MPGCNQLGCIREQSNYRAPSTHAPKVNSSKQILLHCTCCTKILQSDPHVKV